MEDYYRLAVKVLERGGRVSRKWPARAAGLARLIVAANKEAADELAATTPDGLPRFRNRPRVHNA